MLDALRARKEQEAAARANGGARAAVAGVTGDSDDDTEPPIRCFCEQGLRKSRV